MAVLGPLLSTTSTMSMRRIDPWIQCAAQLIFPPIILVRHYMRQLLLLVRLSCLHAVDAQTEAETGSAERRRSFSLCRKNTFVPVLKLGCQGRPWPRQEVIGMLSRTSGSTPIFLDVKKKKKNPIIV